VIERLNLELEVARTTARTNGTSYANVLKGAPFTTPPLPLPPPQPLPQLVPQDDLERRQAVNSLFTLYESQHVQMMKIRTLLRSGARVSSMSSISSRGDELNPNLLSSSRGRGASSIFSTLTKVT
jgi:hypothetical protein